MTTMRVLSFVWACPCRIRLIDRLPRKRATTMNNASCGTRRVSFLEVNGTRNRLTERLLKHLDDAFVTLAITALSYSWTVGTATMALPRMDSVGNTVISPSGCAIPCGISPCQRLACPFLAIHQSMEAMLDSRASWGNSSPAPRRFRMPWWPSFKRNLRKPRLPNDTHSIPSTGQRESGLQSHCRR